MIRRARCRRHDRDSPSQAIRLVLGHRSSTRRRSSALFCVGQGAHQHVPAAAVIGFEFQIVDQLAKSQLASCLAPAAPKGAGR